jgi:nicotinamidase-related amidase
VGARRVDAAGIDGFHGSGLDATLRAAGATHLLLAGHGLEAPVHSTLRSANDRGYECLLVLDASSPLRPDLVPAARSMVEMSGGIFGAVGTTRDVLAALVPLPVSAPAT